MTAKLTNRQIEVLTLVAQGLTDGQIADRLVISPRTAGTHVQDALNTLDAKTRAHAVFLYFVACAGGNGLYGVNRMDGAVATEK